MGLGLGGPDGRLLALFIASNAASVLIFYFSSRYRLPAVPFVAAFAGCGLVELLARFRISSAAGLRFALPGVLAAALSLQTISPAQREFEGALRVSVPGQFFQPGWGLQ